MDVDAPSPDPQIGEASRESIELARDQFEAQQALLDQFSPLYQQQIELQQQMQQDNLARSNDQWQHYQDTFRPLEEQMAAEAASYNTAGRREQAAQEAEAAMASQFGTARQSMQEALNAQGAAGGGRGLAMGNALAIEEAKARAGAGNQARRQTEQTGLALLGSATNFGRGLTNTGMQVGQQASANGQGAMGAVSGLSGLTGAGYGAALQGYGVGINGLTGLHTAQLNSMGAQNGIFGDLMGAGMGIAGMFMSTKEAKTPGKPVSGKKALRGLNSLPVESWSYKPGKGDGGEHVGPYAEDVNKRFGDTVAPGGKAIDMVAMSEVNTRALRELSEQVVSLRKELSDLERA